MKTYSKKQKQYMKLDSKSKCQNLHTFIKFVFSKKTTKINEIFTVYLTITT